ncbi:hypothetical protein [Streptomyces resistomycificus]|uniref:hypothetical protein n=1 Tax=Streptomyces resistomycificus TaxID=67356 RepID=UPI001CED28E6|nr:hypothetical protein [Streptomyces resistomycificus]
MPAHGPTPVPAPVPAPLPRHGLRRLLVAFLVAVVVGVAVGAGVWFLIHDTSARTAADPAVGITLAPITPQSPALGYRRAEDPVGYSVDIPEGWIRTQKQGRLAPVVSYDAPADGRRLQIFRLAEDTPAESLDLAENHPGYGFAAQPGYRPLDRAFGTAWSELTYRYDDPATGPRRVVDHRFESAGGTLYAIRSSGPETLTAAAVREPLTRAVGSFCPTGKKCG